MERVHKEVAELMPWYVNGTLKGDDRARIDKHVRECLPCRAALREEQRIRALVRAEDDVPVSPTHGASDLLRKIDGRGAAAMPFWFRPRFGLGVAAVCVALAGWILLTNPLTRETTGLQGEAAAPFTTLTDGASVAANRIDIVFTDAVAEAEIEVLIDSFGGQVVGGPSEVGRYTIFVPAASEAELFELIGRLSNDPRVRFAGRNYSASPAGDRDGP